MKTKPRRMHVAKITRRHNGKTYTSYLLRRSYRDGAHVRHQTSANLSHLPEAVILLVQAALQGQQLLPAAHAFRITRSLPHGHVHAILTAFRTLHLDTLIAPRPSRQRALILALIAQRLLFASSKLAATRLWHTTTLAEELQVSDAQPEEVYAALDWLLHRQSRIERRLARRHLEERSLVLCDVS